VQQETAWRDLSFQVISEAGGTIRDLPLFSGDEGDFAFTTRFTQLSLA
jgi:hypothetical protein